jgi:hypothetical protein
VHNFLKKGETAMTMSTKEPFEQLNELNKLTTGITKRTTEYVVDAVNGFVGDTAKSLSELSNVKKMEDVIATQARIASEISSKFLKQSQLALHVWQENSTDISKFMESCGHSMGAINPMSILNPIKAAAASAERKA